MKRNIGKTDRMLRLFMVAWFVFLILTGIAHYPQVYFLEVLIVFVAGTIVFNFCPLFALFGINSLEKKQNTDCDAKN